MLKLLLHGMLQAALSSGLFAGLSDVLPGTRGWECIPGVVRPGESFVVEIHLPEPVQAVTLDALGAGMVAPLPVSFRDDGLPPDRVAGDGVYSAGGLQVAANAMLPAHYMNDPASPAGLGMLSVGQVSIHTGSTVESFLIGPRIGVLRADIEPVPVVTASAGLALSPHLINLRTGTWDIPAALRGLGSTSALPAVTQALYAHQPDSYDFLMFFSTHRLEWSPATQAANFTAGAHTGVKVNFTGTGRALMDRTRQFGSAGRLSGVVVLDVGDRGIYSANATHELLHQWGGWLDAKLGLVDAEGHYNPRSSVGSLLGGQRWVASADGRLTLDCTEGRNGARQAAPLDLYLMGLLEAAFVPPVRIYGDSGTLPLFRCGSVIPDTVRTVTILDLVAAHGLRQPGPAAARRHFHLGFVAATRDRLLTPVEMTWYDRLAAHYTRPVPSADAAPYVGFNWAPVTRFFGPGVTWSSRVHTGDLDADGRVGFADLELFHRCATGPAIPYRPTLPPGCPLALAPDGLLPVDFDADGDVDQADFAVLQRMMAE